MAALQKVMYNSLKMHDAMAENDALNVRPM